MMKMLQDLQWDGWRKEIDVMGRIMEGIGTVIITILKWIGKIILGALQLVLNVAKIILLLFGLVARLFLSIVKMGTFDEKRISHREAKLKIAKKAASLIQFRQRIFIDAGSTTRNIAKDLKDENKNVVVANNIEVVEACLQYEQVSTIMLGGVMIRISKCSSGDIAEQQILNYPLDIAFIGAAAVGSDGRLYDGYSPEARFKGRVFEVAKEVYVLVDSSKFNTYDLNSFATLNQVTGIITDDGIDKGSIELLKKYNTTLIIAE